MIIKYNAEEYSVTVTAGMMRAMFHMQLTLAKAGDMKGLKPVQQIQRAMDLVDEEVDLMGEVLGLNTAKDKKALLALEPEALTDAISSVMQQLMGVDEETAEKSEEPA
ncbi:phage tail tube assembly chaperone [Lacticaseibacillus hulanensis]|uniref:phage tail tube assembly chaperone n=1 Tax=Lacticaseibacillus hulanensis TaxID=2493111 RepID=UPI000FDB99A7|nr:phage tail tube assembly chaperone [Lacticaseibacillus hulanensis]